MPNKCQSIESGQSCPSNTSSCSTERSLHVMSESWAVCDWEVMEQDCYYSEYSSEDETTEEEEGHKRIPLFVEDDNDGNDKQDDDDNDNAAPPHNPLRPRIRRGSIHEVILNEDSPVISGCARPKLRRRGTMQEMQDGQQQPPHFSRPLVLEIKGKSSGSEI